MHIRTTHRIIVPVAAVSLLLLIVGVSGAWYAQHFQRTISEIVDLNVNSIIAAEELELQVREIRYELHQFLITGMPERPAAAEALRDEVEEHRLEAERYASTDVERELMVRITKGLDDAFERLQALRNDPTSPTIREQVRELSDNVLTEGVIKQAREYLDRNEKEVRDSSQDNQQAASRLATALFLLGTCGAIAGLVFGYGVARGINRSILQLQVPIRDVAGKLNEVVGPVSLSADPGLEDLEPVLRTVASEVGAVIEKLHASHREMIRADQLAAVGQLAAGLAHELRNPLMCVKVLVQSARRGDSQTLDGRDLEVLEEEITRLESRLQDFLDFARPAKLEKKRTDLNQIVEQTIHFLAPRAGRRGIRITQVSPPAPLWILADAGQMRQVVLNLLLNALDAVTNGGTIEVRTAHEEQPSRNGPVPGDGVILEVADNGRGLPADAANRLFEPFFSTKDTGLGLGLATCRRVVELHGGDVIAADRPEGGAVFRVWLPKPTPVAAAEPATPEAVTAAASTC